MLICEISPSLPLLKRFLARPHARSGDHIASRLSRVAIREQLGSGLSPIFYANYSWKVRENENEEEETMFTRANLSSVFRALSDIAFCVP